MKGDCQVQVEHGKFRTTTNKPGDIFICDMLISEQALNPPPVPPLADMLQDWDFAVTHPLLQKYNLLFLVNVAKCLQVPECQATVPTTVSSFSVA